MRTLLFLLLLAPSLCAQMNSEVGKDRIATDKLVMQYREGGTPFEENKGQFTSIEGQPLSYLLYRVQFGSATLYITETGYSYIFTARENEDRRGKVEQRHDEELTCHYSRVDVNLPGAKIVRENIDAQNPSVSVRNYYFGAPLNEVRDVHSYSSVLIREVYPGIDWRWYVSDGVVKYDFMVHPHADPELIRLLFSWADVKILNDGSQLLVTSPAGSAIEGKLISRCGDEIISSSYVLISSSQTPFRKRQSVVGIALGEYDTSKVLTIDPPFQLQWGTFIGGGSLDGVVDMDIDSRGFIFISGYTFSPNFPVVNQPGSYFDGTMNAGEAFIMKFNNAGQLKWSTFFGGTADGEWGYGMAIDSLDNIFVAGATESTSGFPTLNPGGGAFYDNSFNGGIKDDFIAKFDSLGVLKWSTYFGGNGDEEIYGMGYSPTGEICMVGMTRSSIFVTTNPGGGAFFQGALQGTQDITITTFSIEGVLKWSTYYGGSDIEMGRDAVYRGNGDLMICGSTKSNNFPSLQQSGSYNQLTLSGIEDAYILHFNQSKNLLWATYFGGEVDEKAHSLTIDNSDNLFIYGWTSSTLFPIVDPGNGAFMISTFVSGGGYVCRINPADSVTWSTFLGTTGNNDLFGLGRHIDCDNSGNLYLIMPVGSMSALNEVTYNPGSGAFYNSTVNGNNNSEQYLASFSGSCQMLWGTFMGCQGSDWRGAVVADRCGGNVFFTGEIYTYGFNALFDPQGGAFYDSIIGANFNDDSYIVKFQGAGFQTSVFSQTMLNCDGTGNGSATVLPVGGTGPFSFLWNTGQTTASISGLSAGTYSVTITDLNNCKATQFVTIGAYPQITASIAIQNNNCYGDSSGSVNLTVNSGTAPFNYQWTTGDSVSLIDSLVAGSYTVVIVDSSGCSFSDTVVVTQPAPLTISLSGVSPFCVDSSGSINSTITGGTNPYTYLWSTGGAGTGLNNLEGGMYSLSVTDQNGCSAVDSVLLQVTNAPMLVVDSVTQLICFGDSTGAISISVNAGTGPYDVYWLPQGDTVMNVSGLTAGNYMATVTDINGCIDSVVVAINIPPQLQVSSQVNNVLCHGDSSGSASITFTPLASPYTINWQPTGDTTQLITNIIAGNYSVTVTDSNGCTTNFSVLVTQPPLLNIAPTVTSTSCGNANGSATGSVNGGVPGYNLLWSTGDTSASINNLNAGSYTLVATDVNGCSDSTVMVVGSSQAPFVDAGAGGTITNGQPFQLNGSGIGTYSWLPSGAVDCATCSDPLATPNVSTTFTLTVTDSAGCTASDTVTIFVNDVNCGTVFVPSAFSPNDDNVNDVLFVYGACIREMKFVIYSRWGEEVFSTSDTAIGWNGMWRNQPCESAVFTYVLFGSLNDGTPFELKGNISLVR